MGQIKNIKLHIVTDTKIRIKIEILLAGSTSNSMATLAVQGVLLLGAFWGVFGINVDELSGELEKRLESQQYRDYFPDNLIKISSWNVRYIPTRTICNFIEKTKPMIFGLQDIKRERIDEIAGDNAIQECDSVKRYYKVFPGSPNTERAAMGRYNPIFYKHDRRLKLTSGSQITSANGGTFWLSDNPISRGSKLEEPTYQQPTTPRTCTWLRFRFAEQLRVSYVRPNPFKARILRILRENIRKKLEERSPDGSSRDTRAARVTRAIRRRRVYYKWTSFYVANTRLENEESGVTKSQMKIMNDYFRNIVLDRRRFDVIFMGDLGFNKNSETYSLMINQGWFDDTESQDERTNALEKQGTSYVVRSEKMKGVYADTLYDGGWEYQIVKPVFAAMFTEQSPKREEETNA